MCGRYLRRSDKQRLAETFRLSRGLDIPLPPWDYNVAPTTHQPVIRQTRPSAMNPQDPAERELVLMRWGLVPSFAPSLADYKGISTINARAESLLSSPIWRTPFLRRRCLVPADGFYEWKKLAPPTGKPSAKPARQPFAFTLRTQAPFAFAGLWDAWKDPADPSGATWLQSFTIITTTPNPLTATVHNRMPVILHPEDYDEWLARPAASDSRRDEPPPTHLLQSYPAVEMQSQPAHTDVGNVRNNHPELLNSA